MQENKKKGSTARNVIIALFVVVLVVGWMANSSLKKNLSTGKAPVKKDLTPVVVVMDSIASPVSVDYTGSGVVEANLQTDLKALVSGQVEQILVRKGQKIKKGTPIMKIEIKDRLEKLKEAEAILITKKADLDASKKMLSEGLIKRATMAQSEASYESAKSAVIRAKKELNDTIIVAPYDGVIDDIPVKLGDQLNGGEVVASFLDDDIIKIVMWAPENVVSQIKLDSIAKAKLVNGVEITGKVNFISRIANSDTRTYKVEAVFKNDQRIPIGSTAELMVELKQTTGHRISSGFFVLDTKGVIGIRTLNDNDVVEFYPIEILKEDKNGAWVSGLPNEARVITKGNNFVSKGQKAIGRYAEDTIGGE